MPPPKKMKPSASRAARSNAASPDPPSQIGIDRSRLRYERGSVDPVEAAREVDDRFGEQAAQQLDLLFLPRAAGAEVLPEGLVLDVVPADADTEAQPTAGQEIDIGRLPCDERGLALRKDQDPGRELDALGDPGQIGEHHERIVERVVLGVRARQLRCSVGVNRPEHVVIREQVVEAQIFDRSSNSPNRGRIAAKLVLRIDNTDLHGRCPLDRP